MVSLPTLFVVVVLLLVGSALLIVRGYANERKKAIDRDFDWLHSRPMSQHSIAYMDRW